MQSRTWSRLTFMLMLSIGAALLLASSSQAAAVATHVIHEQRDVIPNGWTRGSRLDKRAILPVRIALKQSNLDKLHDLLMEVSDPTSPKYGQHWTPQQVQTTFAPSQDTRKAVTEWLDGSGIALDRIDQTSGSKGWISFEATVAEVEALFKTQYHSWTHPEANDGAPHPAVAEAYSLPSHIKPHIDFITPTLHFDTKLQRTKRNVDDSVLAKRILGSTKIKLGSPNSPSLPKFAAGVHSNQIFKELTQCDKYITPDCLRALYGVPVLPSFTPTNSKNSLGIVEYSPQQYVPSDLIKFFANYSTNQVQKQPTLVSIDGGNINYNGTGFDYNGESNLDLEYAMTLVNPLKLTLYQTGDAIISASFNNFLDAFDASYCKGDDPTQDSVYPDPNPGSPGNFSYKGPETCGQYTAAKVISTSYAYNEADLTPFYENRQCNEYAKLGLLGTTFTYSSGDYGVAGNSGQCIDPVTGQYNNGTSGKFNPSFPGTCPYILAIGATQVNPGSSVLQAEGACEQIIYSGGGFSNVFPMPSYQKSAVQSYFDNHNPPYTAAQYNNSRMTRGFPDVSANGANYQVVIQGMYYSVFGTSASSPVFASILALINEARLNVGKSTLGFVNPAMYANPSMLNDITIGGNMGCGTPGFSAVKGWDPVTGLGTPNYQRMLAYFLSH